MPPNFLSPASTPSVHDSIFHAADILLAAGVVILQPSTSRVVLIQDKAKWFLPKGRKDKGESLQQTALREGYEESGYRFQFLPLYSGSPAPDPSSDPTRPAKDTEPIFVTTRELTSDSPINTRETPYEYIAFWYVGHIPQDAVHEQGTGMSNESSYTSHLLPIDEALSKLAGNKVHRHIVDYAWKTWQQTLIIDEQRASEAS